MPEQWFDVTTTVGRIRTMISDTDEDDQRYSDTELEDFHDQAEEDGMEGLAAVRTAAGIALIAWASALGREDKSVATGSWKVDRGDAPKAMRELAADLFGLAGYDPSRSGQGAFGSATIGWTFDVDTD